MKKVIKSVNDLLLALIMGAVGLFLLVSDQTVTGRANGLGGFWAQADTYINMLAILLLALAVLQLIYAIDFKFSDTFAPLNIPINREIVITAVALVLYALLLPKLTFFPCTFALSVILCGTYQMKENSGSESGSRKLSKKQIIVTIIYSAVLTIVLYVVFTQLLKCVLP